MSCVHGIYFTQIISSKLLIYASIIDIRSDAYIQNLVNQGNYLNFSQYRVLHILETNQSHSKLKCPNHDIDARTSVLSPHKDRISLSLSLLTS